MNRKYDIIRFAALLLLAAGCFHSCRENDFDDFEPEDRQSLIAQGRYLTSGVTPANGAEEPGFAEGTPYRLLAYTTPYNSKNPTYDPELPNCTDKDDDPRFNKVAWEGETASGLRYINIATDRPDRWFGFSALASEVTQPETGDTTDEEPGDEGLVSLDFYSFTYGQVETPAPGYIALDGVTDRTLPNPETHPLSSLKRTESVSETTGELNDLMWGRLLNQNIATVGHGTTGTQSVVPYAHSFSKLRFKVFQQTEDDGETLCFPGIAVTNVTVTKTPATGAVYLENGKVELPGDFKPANSDAVQPERELKLTYTNDAAVGPVQVEEVPVTGVETPVGEMLVFPSDGSALTNTNLADGYDVGLKITVAASTRKDIENFLRNTGGDPTAVTELDDGRWSGTIVKDYIVDCTDNIDSDKHLYFRQNTIYTLVIWFVRDAVRIITVVPMVEPWIDGEGTETDPWADVALGQPQMFDNVVWSDRNVGADHYDPTDGTHFEATAGYFFQAGRNIPYYPFKYEDFSKNPDEAPTFAQMLEMMAEGQHLSNEDTDWKQNWENFPFRFYPVVDRRILRMHAGDWTMNKDVGAPQMSIPEEMPAEGTYFNFMQAIGNRYTEGLKDDQNMYWDQKPDNQPVAGLWKVPSAKEFVTVFPSTPYAGNISFNKIANKTGLQDWGMNGTSEKDFQMPKAAAGGTDVLRVTVPFYTSDMNDHTVETHFPAGTDSFYKAAWETLRSHGDQGTTHLEQYKYDKYDGNPGDHTDLEPMGDPAPGYASVYIISRAGDDETTLSEDFLKNADPDNNRFIVRSWGTIYAIKRAYTSEAYRMRWRAKIAKLGEKNPCIYIEVCRYRCTADDTLTEENYKTYDWDHPAARIYFPVCGMGDFTGQYINFGMECVYATSDPIKNGKVNALQIKITGNNASNAYMAVVKGQLNRNFGMQIRPVMRGGE